MTSTSDLLRDELPAGFGVSVQWRGVPLTGGLLFEPGLILLSEVPERVPAGRTGRAEGFSVVLGYGSAAEVAVARFALTRFYRSARPEVPQFVAMYADISPVHPPLPEPALAEDVTPQHGDVELMERLHRALAGLTGPDRAWLAAADRVLGGDHYKLPAAQALAPEWWWGGNLKTMNPLRGETGWRDVAKKAFGFLF